MKTHQAYSVNIQSDDGSINQSYYGVNYAKQFLEFIPDKSLVYFYNLAYDACMFMKYTSRHDRIINKSNSHIYQIIASYKSKRIEFCDMLPLTQCPLKELPKAFGITGIKKRTVSIKILYIKTHHQN